MKKQHKNTEEELQLLLRAIRSKQFSFIIAEYNHYSAIQLAKDRITATYPDRKTKTIRTQGITYRELVDAIFGIEEGIVYIEDLDYLVKDPDLYQGFNQRRDKYSDYPIIIIGFMLKGKVNMNNAMRNIADMWSVRSLELELEVELPQKERFPFQSSEQFSTLGGLKMEDKAVEIERLKARLKKLPDTKVNIPIRLNLYEQLLRLCDDTGDYRTGLAYSKEVLQLAGREDFEANNPGKLADIYDRVRLFYSELGDDISALFYGQRALFFAKQKNVPGTIASYQNNLAMVFFKLGNYLRAKELLEKAIMFDEQNPKKNDLNRIFRYSNLGAIYRQLGDNIKAKKLIERAVKFYERNLEDNHHNIASSYSNLGLVLRDLGDFIGAKESLVKAIQSGERSFGENHLDTAVYYFNLALVLQDIGDHRNSETLLRKAHKIYKSHLGEKHPTTKIIKGNLNSIKNKAAS